MTRLLAALALAFALCVSPLAVLAQDSSYIKLPNEDPEMAAAKAKARATLGHFWQKFENPGAGERGFALKVALPYGQNSTEHIWTKDIERKDGKITAVINNVPRDVKGVQLGQRIEVADAQISDWLYLRGDKMVGNFTILPMLKRLPPEQAAYYRSIREEP